MFQTLFPQVIVPIGNGQTSLPYSGGSHSYSYTGNRINSHIHDLTNYQDSYSSLITNMNMSAASSRFSPPVHHQNHSPHMLHHYNMGGHGPPNIGPTQSAGDRLEMIQMYSPEASPRRYMTSHKGQHGHRERGNNHSVDGRHSIHDFHQSNSNYNNNYHKYNRNHNNFHYNHNNHFHQHNGHNNHQNNHNIHHNGYTNSNEHNNYNHGHKKHGNWKRRNQPLANSAEVKTSVASEESHSTQESINTSNLGSYDSDDSARSQLSAINSINVKASASKLKKEKKSGHVTETLEYSSPPRILHFQQSYSSVDILNEINYKEQSSNYNNSKKSKYHHCNTKNSPARHINSYNNKYRSNRFTYTANSCYGNNPHYSEVNHAFNMPYNLNNLQNLHMYFHINPYSTGPILPIHFYVPADRFMAKAHTMQIKEEPKNLFNGGKFDKLTRNIWEKFMSVQQTEITFSKKMMLWKFLFLFIKNFYARYGLFVVGSTMTGLGTNNSDIDLCMFVKPSDIDQRVEAHRFLETLLQLLNTFAAEFVADGRLISAKVPILKFRDVIQGLEVDLNCNNFVGVRNTHLLYCYSQMDWRLRPLVLVLKLWARQNKINSAMDSTISSYSMTLMVIHYLQCGVKPAILPCLHEMFPNKFDPYCDIHSIEMHETLEPFNSENKQTLGELFLGFLDYYTKFDYARYAISIRLARLVDIEECRNAQAPKNEPNHWLFICIEEPFEFTNTARSVYNEAIFQYIKSVFAASHKKLKETLDLNTIFDLDLLSPNFNNILGPVRGQEIRPKVFDSNKLFKYNSNCDSITKFEEFPPLDSVQATSVTNPVTVSRLVK